MKVDYQLLGKKLKQIRLASNFTQQQLAEKVGETSNYISLLENGEQIPSVDLLESIGKELGVPSSVLLVLGTNIENTDTPIDKLISTMQQASNKFLDIQDE